MRGGFVLNVKCELHSGNQETIVIARSPHLVSLRERIAVNNKPIGQDDFDSLVAASLGQAAAARGLQRVSHFEMMTAVAVKHFTSQKVPADMIDTLHTRLVIYVQLPKPCTPYTDLCA